MSNRTEGIWADYIALAKVLALTALLLVFVRTTLVQAFNIPSSSMYPTLQIGDIVLALKWPYGYSAASLPLGRPRIGQERLLGATPSRGDIVVFRWPEDPTQTWVKRVIGLPGDAVSIVGGIPEIVGLGPTEIEPAAQLAVCGGHRCSAFRERLPGTDWHLIQLDNDSPRNRDRSEIVVPPGVLFVLGDNRDDSADSRVPASQGGAGLIPVVAIEGQVPAVLIGFDFEHPETFASLPPVRWSRTGLSVR